MNLLRHYIKNSGGQNTLYTFYTDFVEALEETNSAATKAKDAIKQAQHLKITVMSTSDFLEHLPKEIQYGLIKELP